MRKSSPVCFVVTFLATLTALAGAHFDAKTWRAVQTYDTRTLNKGLEAHAREYVAVKFNFRGKDIHHLKPNWYESSIWQPDPQGKKGFSDVRVLVAKKDLPIFRSVTTDSTAGAEITVYGRVERDTDNSFFFVRLIGRNVVVDPSGNANVSW